ncbi:GNAT family N-acetyltransferase [Chloroflexi bacterium TSY]|nr:GNAT family N-acetyltransferase [Chloroflexi bacterium TSY]
MNSDVILRPPQEQDKKERLALGRDVEFVRMVGGNLDRIVPLTPKEVDEWFNKICHSAHNWVIEADGQYRGTACLHSMNEQDRRAVYSIGLHDPTTRGRGIGTIVTQMVLQYAFTTLNLHRVSLRVLDFNQRAIACYRKCGFVEEGVERETFFCDGQWHNDIMMGILNHEYAQLIEEKGN